MAETSQPGPQGIRRAIAAIVGVQVAIAAALLITDLAGSMPRIDPLTSPGPSGPSTRPYSPDRAPATRPGQTPETGPMPERLEISGNGATVTLTGQIAPGDGARIGQDLATRAGAGQVVETVQLDSTGGSVSDALEIGEVIRDSSIATIVGDGAVCLSACPYIFAGGVERSVTSTGRLGVHQHYFGESTILPAFMAVEDVQRGQAEVMAYLARMGIGLGIMEHAMRTPPDRIYLLSPEELDEYGFVTE
ncbi:hypothetical protein [Maritimibacter sp. UBA3975]|uniref:COG3904 family protein n=1 Tax=Maritimibacter sp. UBA3975 TaxID=1946833 RepID=UPI000C0A7369|nr:hypothetical protein [Maritimibacter sp. UBA3975]MAM63574.1 hypothetical protein [Maritimibacter sp.]|tara:strand:+ start:31348 stop:32091 length:744 start_codon:yes stop_codon:yes gene_type:complete